MNNPCNGVSDGCKLPREECDKLWLSKNGYDEVVRLRAKIVILEAALADRDRYILNLRRNQKGVKGS